MMTPLVGITSYNRRDLLWETLNALFLTTEHSAFELVVVDNGSTDGSPQLLREYPYPRELGSMIEGDDLLLLPDNIGCPLALNRMLAHRKRGQPFVKVDNDVQVLTHGWVERMARFEETHPDAAMIGAYYDGVLGPDDCRKHGETEDAGHPSDAYVVDLLPGHFVWHTGSFLDRVGYFDVLAPNHLYGFEDWIMCQKAACLDKKVYVLQDVEMRNIQDVKSYAPIGGQDKDSHVEAMRPFYRARLKALADGRAELYTPPSGQPFMKGG